MPPGALAPEPGPIGKRIAGIRQLPADRRASALKPISRKTRLVSAYCNADHLVIGREQVLAEQAALKFYRMPHMAARIRVAAARCALLMTSRPCPRSPGQTPLEPIRYTAQLSRAADALRRGHAPRCRPRGAPQVELMMAVWTPGSYLVREYARHVEGVTAAATGRPRRWRREDGEEPLARDARAAPRRVTVKLPRLRAAR